MHILHKCDCRGCIDYAKKKPCEEKLQFHNDFKCLSLSLSQPTGKSFFSVVFSQPWLHMDPVSLQAKMAAVR